MGSVTLESSWVIISRVISVLNKVIASDDDSYPTTSEPTSNFP